MQNTTLLLRIVYCSELFTALLLAVLFETDFLPAGTMAIDEGQEYVFNMLGVILTIIGLPLALKLMTFKRVRAQIQQNEQNYLQWALIRLMLLNVPLIYNEILYYVTGFNTSCGYLALICVVGFCFVWPSKEKMLYERAAFGNQEES